MQDLEKQVRVAPSPSTSSGVSTTAAAGRTQPEEVGCIHTSGTNNEFVHLGPNKFRREDLLQAVAFGGTLNPGGSPAPSRRFANPSPLGLSAFALTTFVLSLVNCQARHVTHPNIVVGLAFFYGGFIQLLAGMWEIVVENTFGALALSSYGGFWLSYGAIVTNSFGILSAYTDESEVRSALGFFLTAWFLFTVMLTACTIRSTYPFFCLFFFLSITFLLLAIGEFANSKSATRAGGVVGLITAFVAWYNAFAGIATKDNSFLEIRPFYLPTAKRATKTA